MEMFFVSYTQADRGWAEWIAAQLEDAGYKAFVQAWDIRPGADFVLAMQAAAAESDRTIAVFSPDSIKAPFPQREWAAALARDPTGKLGVLVPVRVEEVELRGLWVTLVYIDLVGLTEEAAREALLSGVSRGRAKPKTPPAFPGGKTGSNVLDKTVARDPDFIRPRYPAPEPAADDPLDEWSILDVKTDDEGRLLLLFRRESTRLTELSESQPDVRGEARRIEEHVGLDKRSTDGVLRRAEGYTRVDSQPDFFKLLFKLLVPDSVREGLRGSTRLCLRLDADAAHYPWELLIDPADDAPPLSVRTAMIRLPPPEAFRSIKHNRLNELTALVIGQPAVVGVPALPGALDEADRVSDLLREKRGAHVRASVGEGALAVMSALFEMDYRIMHIAGHGTYAPGRPEQSGLILGDGLVLTPTELNNLGSVPDLMFINFGHLSHLDSAERASETTNSLGLLAASFAEALMSMGVPAVVISGWPVDDEASLTFTVEFYRALLAGKPFAESVRRARALTYEAHPGSTAWGAFQCYGSPVFSLAEPSAEEAGDASATPPKRLSDKDGPS